MIVYRMVTILSYSFYSEMIKL